MGFFHSGIVGEARFFDLLSQKVNKNIGKTEKIIKKRKKMKKGVDKGDEDMI